MVISLDGIDTIVAWRMEIDDPIIEATLDWLEDDHADTPDELAELDEDVLEATHTEARSVPLMELTHSQPQLQLEGVRLVASTSSGRGLDLGPPTPSSSKGHKFSGSSTRGCQSPALAQ